MSEKMTLFLPRDVSIRSFAFLLVGGVNDNGDLGRLRPLVLIGGRGQKRRSRAFSGAGDESLTPHRDLEAIRGRPLKGVVVIVLGRLTVRGRPSTLPTAFPNGLFKWTQERTIDEKVSREVDHNEKTRDAFGAHRPKGRDETAVLAHAVDRVLDQGHGDAR